MNMNNNSIFTFVAYAIVGYVIFQWGYSSGESDILEEEEEI